MAYDKLIDSAKLDADLGQIADAIREKIGSEDSFAFPADFVESILSISGGRPHASGSYIPEADVSLPTNVSADPVYLTINVDFLPRIFIFWEAERTNTSSTSQANLHCSLHVVISDDLSIRTRKGILIGVYNTTSASYTTKLITTTIGSPNGSGQLSNLSFTNTKIELPYASPRAYLFAGKEYKWLAIGDE